MDLLHQMCDTARSCASRTQNWRSSHHGASKYVVIWPTSGWRDALSMADLRRLFKSHWTLPVSSARGLDVEHNRTHQENPARWDSSVCAASSMLSVGTSLER